MSEPSAELENSRRTLDKVTYAGLVLPESRDGGGALQIAGASADLRIVPGEARAVVAGNRDLPENVAKALRAFDEFAAASSANDRLEAAGDLAQMTTATLTTAVVAIRTGREKALADTIAAVINATRAYIAANRRPPNSAPAGSSLYLNGLQDRLTQLEARFDRLGVLTAPTAETLASAISPMSVTSEVSPIIRVRPELGLGDLILGPPPPLAKLVADRLGSEFAPHAIRAMEWVPKHAIDLLSPILTAPAATVPAALRENATDVLMEGLPFLIEQVQKTAAIKGHLTQRNLQPIGLLHLEKLVITPMEIERGELVYTLPLAPHEKVTLAHKEWSLREEEHARFVQDYFENYSERGVAEKNDMAVSTRSETEHSKTLSMSKPAVPGAATVADPVSALDTSVDVTKEKQSQERSRRETREITEKASSLAVRDQKVSFTVTTVSGVEDFTAQLFENNHDDKVMTIEYFRRMRKWRNELYRTGLRLTYDVVLPDPGRCLRERWLEVKAIDEQLGAPFEFSAPAPSRAGYYGLIAAPYLFADDEASVADRIEDLARSFGITLPPRPGDITAVEQQRAVTENVVRYEAFAFNVELNIPDGNRVTKLWVGGQIAPTGDADVRILAEYWSQQLEIKSDGAFVSRTVTLPASAPQRITVGFLAFKGAIGKVRVWANVEPTSQEWRKWRAAATSLLRQAALIRFNENRELLRQRRAALLSELEAGDALTLRRMEREQIMHLVLRWLFPDFTEGSQAYKDSAAQKAGSWQPALEYGEYIKFVHRAIDWDHALVLLYPFFWDNPETHKTKLYLDHPDAAHREFLRAGAARVILAIQPGFEGEVISLLDKGQLGQIAASSRFQPVISKVLAANKRFAKLLDAPLQPPEEDEEGSATAAIGELIGRWFDWTPTSALEMDATLKPVASET